MTKRKRNPDRALQKAREMLRACQAMIAELTTESSSSAPPAPEVPGLDAEQKARNEDATAATLRALSWEARAFGEAAWFRRELSDGKDDEAWDDAGNAAELLERLERAVVHYVISGHVSVHMLSTRYGTAAHPTMWRGTNLCRAYARELFRRIGRDPSEVPPDDTAPTPEQIAAYAASSPRIQWVYPTAPDPAPTTLDHARGILLGVLAARGAP